MDDKRQRFTKVRRIRAVLNGRSRQGQSLVELVFTLPLLLLLFAGLVEIGWYANNYLILLDATREAGRYGSTKDPVGDWNMGMSDAPFRHDCCAGQNDCVDPYRNDRPEVEDYWAKVNTYLAGLTDPTQIELIESVKYSPLRYFDGVACQVVYNLPPLEFDWERDEVVVSVFSYVGPYGSSDYRDGSEFDTREDYLAAGTWGFHRIAPTYPTSGGRYPIERNQCVPTGDESTTTDHIGYTLSGVGSSATDCPPGSSDEMPNFCAKCNPSTGEFCSNHRRENDYCYGSEWDPLEVEERLYKYDLSGSEAGLSGGIVLVEIFWHHDMLLDLPFFTALMEPNDEVYVWVMFPVSAAEPTPTPLGRP